MQMVCSIVLCECVSLSVQLERPPRDAIGHAAAGGTEIGVPSEVAGKRIASQDDIDRPPVGS